MKCVTDGRMKKVDVNSTRRAKSRGDSFVASGMDGRIGIMRINGRAN